MTNIASRTNRRQFLEESMLAAAAVAAAGPGELLWDEPAASRSANEQLGVAVIGVRGRGNTHLGFFTGRRDTRVLYVCDVDHQVGASRVAQVAKRQGGRAPALVADMRYVFDDPRVDLVSIATPHHWHALAALWAMQAGKDVYVEKPIAHTLQEGRCLVQAARRHQRICQAGMQARSNRGAIDTINFVRGGGVGRVSQARAICYRQRPSIGPRGFYAVPRHINYDLWLGPAATAPLTRPHFHHDWHWQWPYGSGELGHQGLHPLDLCRWGLGLTTISRQVLSWGGRFVCDDSAQTTNTQVTTLDFGNKSIVVETRGLPSQPYRNVQVGVIFEGSDGYVVMTSHDHGVAFDHTGREMRQFHGGGGGSAWHFRNFLQAVRRRSCRELNADVEEGHVSSALVHLANMSYRLGRRVSFASAHAFLTDSVGGDLMAESLHRTELHLRDNGVDLATASLRLGARLTCDPAQETIVNHAAANALLTRNYRRPFVVPAAGSV
jgi:predicted dehydrogenase